ncbi:MAG: GntR family transcriptional regulator [Actinomycetia bacterium]|nr:GntR family transcriptional regulator [Actinomycetes bacterium]MCP4226519.1 GntR family transcriptional regulator [Actinomycetes bacterium]MCP5030407.1 GntR family transcriptional regulator [Actinomycetes bacterium]
MKRIRYHQIADDLRHRIGSGQYPSGHVLPSEAALGAEHDASRVTIRKALEVLRSEGLVDSRQGFGWLVAAETLPQPLSGLVTIEAQLAASGRKSERRVLDFAFVDAPEGIAEVLGERVLEVRRLNLADGEPFARVTVWCREDLASPLSKAAVERSSFLELVDERPGGATQTMGAQIVDPDDAALLGIPSGAAVLVVRRITHSSLEHPILVSEHVFPGHLTELVAELPWTEDHEAAPPPGLRLVEEY